MAAAPTFVLITVAWLLLGWTILAVLVLALRRTTIYIHEDARILLWITLFVYLALISVVSIFYGVQITVAIFDPKLWAALQIPCTR